MKIIRGARPGALGLLLVYCTALALMGCGGGSGSSATPSPPPQGNTPPQYTKKAIAGLFMYPQGVAVDTAGDVFVADAFNNKDKKIAFTAGYYGIPTSLGSG